MFPKFENTIHIGITLGGEPWLVPGFRIHRLSAFDTYLVAWLWFGVEVMVFRSDTLRPEEERMFWQTPGLPE